jgi:hexokinase
MNIHLHHHHSDGDKLDQILVLLQTVLGKVDQMASDLTDLTTQVQAETDAETSAITLLTTLSADIASLKNDPVAIQALSDKLKANAATLAAAVVANTPAA